MLNSVWMSVTAALCFAGSSTDGARILAVFPVPARSHFIVTNTIVQELASRGHEVTVIGNFPQKYKNPNITDIVIQPGNLTFLREHRYDNTETSIFITSIILWRSFASITEHALKDESVQKFIRRNDLEFDLVIVENFVQDATLMFAHQFKSPIVAIATFGLTTYMGPAMGQSIPWSHVPHEFLPYGDHMTFWERLHTVVVASYDSWGRWLYHIPVQNQLAHKYFTHLPGPLPDIADLERRISVVLLNSHTSNTLSKPLVPGFVEVGGMHVQPPKALPQDIKKYLDESTDGAIYFSMGSNLHSSDMHADKVQQILSVFKKLKQRVLWKWEDDSLTDLPPNVKIQKWFPQSDVLAHPNICLFISHGGLLSTMEAIQRGIPLIGIPIYGDQHLNMHRAEKSGYAITIKYTNLTSKSLEWAIGEVLHNDAYGQSIRRISTLFNDRPTPPLDTAVFWIEHVIRTKGAPHLRSGALDLHWFSFYLLDVVLFVAALLFAFLFIGYNVAAYFVSTKCNVMIRKKEKAS